MSIGIKPIGARVVIKEIEVEKRTESGIVLAGTKEERPQYAEVVAVGPGTEDEKMQLQVGEKVIFSQYAGTPVKYNGTEYMIMNQRDILAVVEE